MKTINQFRYNLYINGRLCRKGTCDNFPFLYRGEPIPEGSTLRIHTEGEFAKWFFMRSGDWQWTPPTQSRQS